MLRNILNRILYMLWIFLCIFDAFLIMAGFFIFANFLLTIEAICLGFTLPILYQLGLDHLDWENCQNIIEGEGEEDNDKK